MDPLKYAPLLLLSLSAACGSSVIYSPLHSPAHVLPARATSSVEVYENERPTRPYVVVGIVEAQPDSMYADTKLTPEIKEEMRRSAARAGCDALVMQGSSPAPEATYGGRAVASVSYRGSCVVFASR